MSELALKLIAENKTKHVQGEDARLLDLGYCGLLEIPEEIGELVWLEELIFSNEWHEFDFKTLSSEEETSSNYREGSPNRITRLPNSLNLLINLKKVIACGHSSYERWEIHDLMPLSSLKNLQYLDLRRNQISDIEPLKGLNNLRYINLSLNNLRDLVSLGNLQNLVRLDASFNSITSLNGLQNLQKLTFLDLRLNQITDLEPIKNIIFNLDLSVKLEGGQYKSDKLVQLDRNPLQHPPSEVIQQGNAAIFQYFSEREKQQFKNTEIKLILVGNATTGKTSLSQFLRERTYVQRQPSTHGILHQKWQPDGRQLQVNLWDFGGQEYYHATHRLFLSRNAIYVLVWDSYTDKGGFYETPVHFDNDPEPRVLQLEHFPQKWWLQNIRHYTRESNPPVPIVMVQNKSARDSVKHVSGEFEHPPFNLKPEWLENHIDIEAAAAHLVAPKPETRKWQRSFENFEELLLDRLEHQLTKYEFAVYHRDIRDKVRQLATEGVNDMPYLDFEKLCRAIEADAKMDLVQIYLRDIAGDILYYPHNERLRERVFLRPAWACESIYQILSRQVQTQQGLFGLDWVCEALRCDEANALDFVALMCEFGLVFPENNDEGIPTGQLVAPQYLPNACTKPDKLEAAIEYANLTHAFTLWFPDFLPKSHIARFVAHWGSQAKQRLFWKNGLLFQTEGCTSLVERISEGKIRVNIQSSEKPKCEAAMQRIFQSFMHLEDGLAGFAVSLDAEHFVWWLDVQDAIQTQARQVKVFPPEPGNYLDLQPFTVFQKPIMSAKKVFISYSKSDKSYLTELKRHLASLKRQDLLQTWDDTDLKPGEEWDTAIRRELNAADIVILLVSSDLIATDYIWDIEMKAAMERHQNGEVTVIPVIVRPSNWEDAPFGILNALPEKGKPISKWEDRDEGWAQVVARIKQVVK